jgi:hypothetical protein
MERQLADVKSSTDERIKQQKQVVHESQEGWQMAVERATLAETRVRELEKNIARLQEQQVDETHRQLHQPEAPPVGNSSADPIDEPMEGRKYKERERIVNGFSDDDDIDMDMVEVTSC